MPKIQRKTQKIFCNSAENDQLAVFGSMAAGTPVYTNDVEQLQSNEAYTQGWESATLEDKAPFMEEMNGVQYGLSYQLAYNFQEGIPEYDAGTTYYIGSIVKNIEDNTPVLYTSLTDGNIGNPLTDTVNWSQLSLGGGSSLPIGSTIVLDRVLSYEESQGLALQGTYVYKTAIAGERYGYPDFYEQYVGYKNNATATQTTLGSSTITIYNNANGLKFYNIADKGVIDTFFNSTGVADFYGVDETNERIFLPRNKYFAIKGATSNTTVGGSGKALYLKGSGGSQLLTHLEGYWFGPGKVQSNNYNIGASVGGGNGNYFPINKAIGVSTDFSKSGLAGETTTTLTPNEDKYLYYVVGNTVSDTSWVDVVTQVEGGVKDLEDKTNEGIEALANASNALRTTQITNCITEIPQDIKLELNDGVLTLKAGSKVYVPNGFEADGTTPKFDEVVVESDIAYGDWAGRSRDIVIYLNADSNQFTYNTNVNETYSGDVAPTLTHTYAVWYDTQNNIIKHTNDTGATWESNFSLPIAVCYQDADMVLTSIKEIFNGFGYIGSTVFVLPNVKGLIPNGRNEDGSLNNIEVVTGKVATVTNTNTFNFDLALYPNGLINATNIANSRNDEKNNYYYTGSTQLQSMSLGTGSFTTSGVSSFTPKLPFRAVDYSDSSTVSGWGMPSSKYIDLTLGASNTTYTAPANGYYFINAQGTDTNNWIEFRNGYIGQGVYGTVGWGFKLSLPIAKGHTTQLAYNNINTTNYTFRFVYAEGEV